MTLADNPENESVEVEDGELRGAAKVIAGGGVVAFPTETFYGLAVDPFNELALDRLFRLKDRPLNKPVLLLIDNVSRLEDLVAEIPDQYPPLMEKFWPGPLTLIFPGRRNLASLVTDSAITVAIRISSHPVSRRLAEFAGGAITGTSANSSGQPPAVSASQVKEMFPAGIDHIIDGGMAPGGSGSTIVGTDGGDLRLVRAGAIPYETILKT